MRDNEGNVNGISLNYHGGAQKCVSDPSKDYWLTVNITCAKEDSITNLIWTGNAGDSCHPTLNYISPRGCYVFSFDQFTTFMMKYNYLWGALMIVMGFFLCFFGNKFVNLVIFLVVAFACLVILGSLFFQYALFKVKEEWAKWLSLAGIIGVSCLIGWSIMRARKYGIGLVSAWGGVMVGFIITTAFVVGPAWAYYLILAVSGALAFYVAIKVEKTVVIISTSFIGAYGIVRGVSLYVGGFPSETDLHEEISTGVIDFNNFSKKFYIYLGAILVATIIGVVYQKKKD
jgi:hypothetical protein